MEDFEVDENELFDIPEGMIVDEFSYNGKRICVVADIMREGQDIFMEKVDSSTGKVLVALSATETLEAMKKYNELREIF